MAIIRFWIDGIPPNDNATRRLVWQAKAKEREQWRHLAFYAATAGMRVGRASLHFPLDKALVRFDFHFGARRRHDWDNLVASLKPVIDGIVDAGVVVDDDLKHFRGEIGSAVYGEKKPGIWISVSEGEW